jgi:hypothetical protein
MPALRRTELESVRALANILIPKGGTLEASASDAGVAERVATWIDRSPGPMKNRYRLLIRAWDLGPLFARGYMKRFHRLDPEKQEKWVAATHHSRRLDRRMPVTLLKQLIYLTYASSPEVEKAIGYDYTCRLDNEPHARIEA